MSRRFFALLGCGIWAASCAGTTVLGHGVTLEEASAGAAGESGTQETASSAAGNAAAGDRGRLPETNQGGAPSGDAELGGAAGSSPSDVSAAGQDSEGGASGAPWEELPAGAALFDGSDDRVQIPDDSVYNLGSGDFTFYVRARVDSTRSAAVVPFLSRRLDERDGFLFIGYYGTLLLQMNGVPNFVVKDGVPELSDDCFHTFAVTRQSHELTFYVDGRASPAYMDGDWSAPVGSARSIDAHLPISIGFDPPTGLALAGDVAEVAIWSRALRAAELTGQPRAERLIGRWGLGGVTGQDVPDLSRHGNDAFLGSDPLLLDSREPTPSVAPSGCIATP